ncbi:MAG: hypothetical protein AB1540_11175 [Bdellovibrionota bacterium]
METRLLVLAFFLILFGSPNSSSYGCERLLNEAAQHDQDTVFDAQALATKVIGTQRDTAKELASRGISFLVTASLSSTEKIALWKAMVPLIRSLASERWNSEYFSGKNGEAIFVGEGNDALVIPQSGINAGRVFRGKIDLIDHYEALTKGYFRPKLHGDGLNGLRWLDPDKKPK